MKLRESEYLENGLAARWLDALRAKNAYDYALQFSAKTRYGLCEATVDRIEHLDIESRAVADAWLRRRLPIDGTVHVVYGDDEVCVVPAASSWRSGRTSLCLPETTPSCCTTSGPVCSSTATRRNSSMGTGRHNPSLQQADSPRAELGQLVQGMRLHPQTHSPSERACRFGNDIVAG